MAYRLSATLLNFDSGTDQTGAGPNILQFAAKPFRSDGSIEPKYDGNALLYAIYGIFPILAQFPGSYENWSKMPERNGIDVERQLWRLLGRNNMNWRFQFVRDANEEVNLQYDKILKFSSGMIAGVNDAMSSVVQELVSWPDDSVPPTVISETIRYMKDWIAVSSTARTAIEEVNNVLQRQLQYNKEVLNEAIRFSDTLQESMEAEISFLQAKVRELEKKVIELLEENVALRKKLAEQNSIIEWLSKMAKEGKRIANEAIDNIGKISKGVGVGLAFGGITALIVYAGLGLGAFFLLRRI